MNKIQSFFMLLTIKSLSLIILLLCSSISLQGQFEHINIIPPRLDTLCYPFEDGVQMIIINHEDYIAMQNRNALIAYGHMSSIPPIQLPRDNEYFFRDSSRQIINAFNRLNPSLDSLTNAFKHLSINTFRDRVKNEFVQSHLQQTSLSDRILDWSYFLVAKAPRTTSCYINTTSKLRTLENNVGLINRVGKLTVPYHYKDLKPIGDYFFAYQKDKVGIITPQNKVLVPVAFDRYLYETDNLYTFWKNEECQGVFFLKTGTFTPIKRYQELYYLKGLEKYGFAQFKKNEKYGLINKNFEEVIPAIYDEMKNYSHFGYYKIKKDNFYGLLDTAGHLMVPIQYSQIGDVFSNNRMLFVDSLGKYGFLNKDGEEVIPGQYDYAMHFYHDKTAIFKEKLAAFINTKGTLLTPYQYQRVQYRRAQFEVTNEAGLLGILSQQLKEIVPCLYKRIHYALGSKQYHWVAILANGEKHKYTKEGERIN